MKTKFREWHPLGSCAMRAPSNPPLSDVDGKPIHLSTISPALPSMFSYSLPARALAILSTRWSSMGHLHHLHHPRAVLRFVCSRVNTPRAQHCSSATFGTKSKSKSCFDALVLLVQSKVGGSLSQTFSPSVPQSTTSNNRGTARGHTNGRLLILCPTQHTTNRVPWFLTGCPKPIIRL